LHVSKQLHQLLEMRVVGAYLLVNL
jgi:hypothetical protein